MMTYVKPKDLDDIVIKRQIEGLEYAIKQDIKNDDRKSLYYHQTALNQLKSSIKE